MVPGSRITKIDQTWLTKTFHLPFGSVSSRKAHADVYAVLGCVLLLYSVEAADRLSYATTAIASRLY